MPKLGSAIRRIRTALDMQLSEVAKEAGISIPLLSQIESGDKSPSLKTLEGIARALSIPVDALVLIASQNGSSIKSTDEIATGLAQSIDKLLTAEGNLKAMLSSMRDDNEEK